ncbi:PDC sensor domain-containing protein [Pseudomonas sp. TTU2014-080ASC]|uniref:PDC sensor domain-containing protein n=1 Tax=Pseudomonas sp. TTU2014-080ASC TaxID=1729724 RepID=UPI0007184115|nr:PDC sensor domain-containing protein [Pseudomonas sp. TTU2014-080ASC]KRW58817.1 hypothetical protein AO726_14970 [Pseudomonas sp. TTU2014-080ASC]
MPGSIDVPVCIERLNSTLHGVFANLQELSQEVERIWTLCDKQKRKPSSRDLSQLRELIDDQLLGRGTCAHGSGVVMEPGELSDQPMYLEWWRLAGTEKTLPLMLNFNQRSESFYNYTSMPWFSGPRESGKGTVEGPYVDLYGSDMYVLTCTIPIFFNQRFIGVAGADLPLHQIERVLISCLMRLPHEALLVSATGRVIVANTADWAAGDLALRIMQSDGAECYPLDNDMLGWQLVCLPQPLALSAA